MAVGDNTTDSIVWFPGEATGKNPGGQSVSPPTPSSGVAQQLIRRDFTVNFDDENVDDLNTGVVLWEPVEGEVILDCWAYPIEKFEGGDAAILYIGGNVWYDSLLDAVSGGGNGPDLLLIDPPAVGVDLLRPATLTQSDQSLDARAGITITTTEGLGGRRTNWIPAAVGDNGMSIIAAITVTNGPLTAGSLKIITISAIPE